MAPRQQLLVGSATGILLGALLGLSAAPVVAAFIGGLTALLMTLFSVQRKSETSVNPYVIFSFAFGCLGGVALGVATRTHSWLSPSLSDRKSAWRELEYSPTEARDLAAYEHLGLLLVTDGQHPHFTKITEPPGASVLHSENTGPAPEGNEEALPGCNILRAATYSDVPSARNGIQAAGRTWKEIVNIIDEYVPDSKKLQAFLRAKEGLCAR